MQTFCSGKVCFACSASDHVQALCEKNENKSKYILFVQQLVQAEALGVL